MRVVFSAVESEGGLDGVRVAGGRPPRDHLSDKIIKRPCSAAVPVCRWPNFSVHADAAQACQQARLVEKDGSASGASATVKKDSSASGASATGFFTDR